METKKGKVQVKNDLSDLAPFSCKTILNTYKTDFWGVSLFIFISLKLRFACVLFL